MADRKPAVDGAGDKSLDDLLDEITPAELDTRQREQSSTLPDERARCEECGSTDLRPRQPAKPTSWGSDLPYYCGECSEPRHGEGP